MTQRIAWQIATVQIERINVVLWRIVMMIVMKLNWRGSAENLLVVVYVSAIKTGKKWRKVFLRAMNVNLLLAVIAKLKLAHSMLNSSRQPQQQLRSPLGEAVWYENMLLNPCWCFPSNSCFSGSRGFGVISNRCPATRPCPYRDGKCGRVVSIL